LSMWREREGLGDNAVRLFAELDENLVAYQPSDGKWFAFPTPDAAKDWAGCLFCESADSLAAGGVAPIFFLLLGGTCGMAQRSPLVLLEFLRYLRLSKYHLKAWGSPYWLWRSRVVCYSFEPRERILRRKPEALVLFSPSVSFKHLPSAASPSLLEDARGLKEATDGELVRYLNSVRPVNLSSHHLLGDMIGPYSILQAVGAGRFAGVLSPGRLRVKVLHEILWQMEQEKNPGEERAHGVGAVEVEELKAGVHASVARSARGTPPTSVLIIDDQTDLWQPVWMSVLGPAAWSRLHPHEVFRLMDAQGNEAARERFFKCLRQFVRLIVLDLRLMPEHDLNQDLQDISGYRMLRFIREHDQAIPVLMFTSSRRGHYLHQLELAGADAVCIKPTRFDDALPTLESLLEHLSVLLRPEYQYLQDCYYDLHAQEAALKPDDEKNAPLYWAMSALHGARRNVRLWIRHPESSPARLSALSVARTAGLAAEMIKEKFESSPQPYVHSMMLLRHAASHFGSAQTMDTAVGYVAVGLVVKMLSAFDNSLIPTAVNRTKIKIPDAERLKEGLEDSDMEPTPLKVFQGTVQVATLSYALRRNASAMKLSGPLADFVSALESAADRWIVESLKKHRLSKDILLPMLSRARDELDLTGWFNSL
jgi:CheY-like chemotaxis protein